MDLLGWGSLETWLLSMAVGVHATPEFIADMKFEPVLISLESAMRQQGGGWTQEHFDILEVLKEYYETMYCTYWNQKTDARVTCYEYDEEIMTVNEPITYANFHDCHPPADGSPESTLEYDYNTNFFGLYSAEAVIQEGCHDLSSLGIDIMLLWDRNHQKMRMVYIAGPDRGEDFVYNGEEIGDGVMRFSDIDNFHTVIAMLGYNDDGT